MLLIVNTASQCGLTPQFAGLQKLYEQYGGESFEILGFPCNQFASQDPGDDSQISEFCQLNYGVTFPMFAKIEVNGSGAHPLFKHLTREAPGLLGSKSIKWNFTKFVVGRDGRILKRFAPTVKPEKIDSYIRKLL
ncbi:MAG: glutathione peroxidase [Paenibacillus sp.]|nr:glutathione peroxidase [Paenibacillus sp.]